MVDFSRGPICTDSRSWLEHQTKNGSEKLTIHFELNNDSQHNAGQDDNYSGSTRMMHSSFAAGLKHASVFAGFSLPVAMFIAVLNIPRLYNFHSEYWNSKFNHCNFNGVFTPFNDPSISQWDPSGLLYITVAWGKMSFPTAKGIDVVWDNIAGRAVQAILGWITYMVSSQYLSMAMREAPVSYSTYEALAFVPPTFMRTLGLARDLLTRRGMLTRVITVWIVSSSLFVISFSSWATAMTGYSSNTFAAMETYGGELVDWENYQVVQFAISDAWRIGEPNPVLLMTGSECVAAGFSDDEDEHGEEEGEEPDENDVPWEYIPAKCLLFWRTLQCQNSRYGFSPRDADY